MALKDLMVHLDPGARTPVRLDLAITLAEKHDARLVGVFAQRALPEQVGVVATWPSADYVAAAQASKAAFDTATLPLRAAEWRDINRGSDSELLRRLIEAARCADMVIVGQHDDAVEARVPPELAEELVIHSGRPILVVPFAGEFPQIGRRPLIAWDQSRESAHALHASLRLIEGCRDAFVVSLDKPFDEAERYCTDVARHLECHGIKARTEVLMAEDEHMMDFLLNRVTDLDADLLVIGAHRQSSFLRPGHSADSRTIMRQMVVPTLVAR